VVLRKYAIKVGEIAPVRTVNRSGPRGRHLGSVAPIHWSPRHGYAVIAEVEAISGGRVRMRTGTLYAALDRLQQLGLVPAAGEEAVDGRHRRYYASTDGAARRCE